MRQIARIFLMGSLASSMLWGSGASAFDISALLPKLSVQADFTTNGRDEKSRLMVQKTNGRWHLSAGINDFWRQGIWIDPAARAVNIPGIGVARQTRGESGQAAAIFNFSEKTDSFSRSLKLRVFALHPGRCQLELAVSKLISRAEVVDESWKVGYPCVGGQADALARETEGKSGRTGAGSAELESKDLRYSDLIGTVKTQQAVSLIENLVVKAEGRLRACVPAYSPGDAANSGEFSVEIRKAALEDKIGIHVFPSHFGDQQIRLCLVKVLSSLSYDQVREEAGKIDFAVHCGLEKMAQGPLLIDKTLRSCSFSWHYRPIHLSGRS